MQNQNTNLKLKELIPQAFLEGKGREYFGKNKKKWIEESDKLCEWFEKHYGTNNEKDLSDKKAVDKSYNYSGNALDITLGDIIENSDAFICDVILGIKSLPKDKHLYAYKIEHLIKFLNEKYSANISIGFLDYLKWSEKEQRLLKELKYMHAGGKTRSDIASVFGVSTRILDKDISTLKDGFEFMGTRIQIGEMKRAENTYESPVHPVFLALNSAEIYAMTIGLKLLSENTLFQHALSRVSDLVYSQLSDFARELVDCQPEAEDIIFDNEKRKFLSSREMTNYYDKPFCQYIKSQKQYTVRYRSEDRIKEIIGTVHLSPSRTDRFQKIMIRNEDKYEILKIEDIVRICDNSYD